MNDILNPESPVMDFLRRLSDLIILNVIFILSCIPVVTIGAAVTSLYTVTLRIANLEDPHIWQSFWRAFRQNFMQSLWIWLTCLVVFALLLVDFLFLQTQTSALASYMQMALWMVAILFLSVLHYVFPIEAHFICTVRQVWKNALLMSVAHLPYTVLFLVLDGLIVFAALQSVQLLGAVFMILLICGFSCIALTKSFLFRRIFKIYDPEQEDS